MNRAIPYLLTLLHDSSDSVRKEATRALHWAVYFLAPSPSDESDTAQAPISVPGTKFSQAIDAPERRLLNLEDFLTPVISQLAGVAVSSGQIEVVDAEIRGELEEVVRAAAVLDPARACHVVRKRVDHLVAESRRKQGEDSTRTRDAPPREPSAVTLESPWTEVFSGLLDHCELLMALERGI